MNKLPDAVRSVNSILSSCTSAPPPQCQYNSDINYVNSNFADISETSSQETRAVSDQQDLQKNQQQQQQQKQSQQCDESPPQQQQKPHEGKHQQKKHHLQGNLRQKDHDQESQKELQQQDEQKEYKLQENHQEQLKQQQNQMRTSQASFSTISSPTLVTQNETTVDADASLSLKEMGFKTNKCKNWKRLSQPKKTNLTVLLKNFIENFIKPDVQIRIGTIHFNCHMMVLQCYSEFFKKFSKRFFIKLPEKKVTPAGFMMTYKWMLTDKPLIQRESVIELLKAATFLRIEDLLNQCWEFLDNDERIREDIAYFLYVQARQHGGLENLEQLMITRISKFFLTLVASYDFLNLRIKDIISLLSSNMIGVTSETEVFMSAVRWLNHNWADRKQHVVNVMKTVRFALLPPYLLVIYTKETDCIEIDRILAHPEVKDMIIDGMTLSSMRRYYANNGEQMLKFLKRHNLVMPLERRWVHETENNITKSDPIITYQSFLTKLQNIQAIGKDYWHSLEFCTNFEESCTNLNSKKGSDQ